eukprot:TRINITY_DN19190_c0_g1_i1.p1 TRINITY_DN19190_c0_g1~~TRINITY_DN19190_c0_g1_i1.p1  ORF type:complete len:123 (+),score=8.94 TRINITY_DN19190_c0_g1_i1:34-402(+)
MLRRTGLTLKSLTGLISLDGLVSAEVRDTTHLCRVALTLPTLLTLGKRASIGSKSIHERSVQHSCTKRTSTTKQLVCKITETVNSTSSQHPKLYWPARSCGVWPRTTLLHSSKSGLPPASPL